MFEKGRNNPVETSNTGLGGRETRSGSSTNRADSVNFETERGTETNPNQPAEKDFSKLKGILDVPFEVKVTLASTKMFPMDLLNLGDGSVIPLDKIAGEPLEILINEKLFALGEVVVINEKYGIRITDVAAQIQQDTGKL